jgi:alpha-aminoadipate/glutamate carrier protein LysW
VTEESTMTLTAPCPECDAQVPVSADGTEVGDLLVCDDCGAELEVLDASQPRLGIAPPVEEDWGE